MNGSRTVTEHKSGETTTGKGVIQSGDNIKFDVWGRSALHSTSQEQGHGGLLWTWPWNLEFHRIRKVSDKLNNYQRPKNTCITNYWTIRTVLLYTSVGYSLPAASLLKCRVSFSCLLNNSHQLSIYIYQIFVRWQHWTTTCWRVNLNQLWRS